MKTAGGWVMVVIVGAMTISAPFVRAQNVGERIWTPPASGNFFLLSNTNLPPIPWCPDLPIYYLGVLPGMSGPCYGYDDSSLNARMTEDSEPPPIPGDGDPGSDPGVPPSYYPPYGPGDLWLEANHHAGNPLLVDLTLHGTRSTNVYQLEWRTDIVQTNWVFGEVMLGPNDGDSDFTPVGVTTQACRFFRAEQASTAVEITAGDNAIEPPATHTGNFVLSRRAADFVNPLTVHYTISGSRRWDWTTRILLTS